MQPERTYVPSVVRDPLKVKDSLLVQGMTIALFFIQYRRSGGNMLSSGPSES
jgi:hypothetical protein